MPATKEEEEWKKRFYVRFSSLAHTSLVNLDLLIMDNTNTQNMALLEKREGRRN